MRPLIIDVTKLYISKYICIKDSKKFRIGDIVSIRATKVIKDGIMVSKGDIDDAVFSIRHCDGKHNNIQEWVSIEDLQY